MKRDRSSRPNFWS